MTRQFSPFYRTYTTDDLPTFTSSLYTRAPLAFDFTQIDDCVAIEAVGGIAPYAYSILEADPPEAMADYTIADSSVGTIR